MIGQQLFFHSPFSPGSVSQGGAPSLLLQLIIHELIKAKDHLIETAAVDLAPFDWMCKPGSKNKVREYAVALEHAFPHLAAEAKIFLTSLEKPCSELLICLEPFIFACKNNENLLFFLFKHQKSLSIKSILDKICPEGVAKLKKEIAAQYKKRGFHITKWTH